MTGGGHRQGRRPETHRRKGGSMRHLTSENFLSGIMFIAFGLLALIGARSYSYGTNSNIGPGYFPTVLGWALLGIGGLLATRAVLSRSCEEQPLSFKLRPFAVLVAVVVFALLLPMAGLLVATAAMFAIAGLAAPETRWIEVVILYGILMLIATVGLIWGLGLQIRLY
ncbi:tripartite tricarboxylate transporter TctB family protein [Pseudochelatococcus sp. B33]